MRHALVCGLLLLVFMPSNGCRHTPPTVTSPQAKVAYALEDAVDAVNFLQHEAIRFNKAGKLSPTTTRKIVAYRRHAANLMDHAIDAGTGQNAAIQDASNGLLEVENALLGKPEKDVLRAAIDAVRVVLVALGGER